MQDDIGPLLHHVSTELDQISNQVLQERLGIGLSQFRIMLVVQARNGTRQNQIAEELAQTEAAVSRQVKLLNKSGLVDIRRSTANRREHHIFMTPKGDTITEKSREVLNEYHGPLFARLHEKEQWQLLQSLQKIKSYLA